MSPILEKWSEKDRAEGRAEARVAIIQQMIRKGLSEEQIKDLIGCSEEEFKKAEKDLLVNA